MINLWQKPGWKWYRIGLWTDWLFRNIKYTKQRATRGYCDIDIHDLRLYLSHILADGLDYMANQPESALFDYEEREWGEKLRKLVPTFKKVIDFIELNTPEFDRYCEKLAQEKVKNIAATVEGLTMMDEETAVLENMAWSSIHKLENELYNEVPETFSELGTIFLHLWD